MLKRLTNEQLLEGIRLELERGNFCQTAERVKSVCSRKPELAPDLVVLLADALAEVGDRNPGKRGRRAQAARTEEQAAEYLYVQIRQIAAVEDYNNLLAARDLVDGRRDATDDVELQAAKALLRQWGLANTARGKFRMQLRNIVATRHGLTERKLCDLIRN